MRAVIAVLTGALLAVYLVGIAITAIALNEAFLN